MKESIVCIGRIGDKPYRFRDTGIQISSYEELCYYLSQHMLCYLYSLPGEDLNEYIYKELGLTKLAKQLSKLSDPEKDQMKYFATLFREGHYFTEDDIRDILDSYRSMKNESYARQCKWTGDMLMENNKAGRAILFYNEALNKDAGDATEAGKIYHNLGIAQARLFRFQDARISFLKAYQKTSDENSLFYYFMMIALNQGVGKAIEELKLLEISELTIDSFESRFSEYMDSFRNTEQENKFRKWEFLIQNGKSAEANVSLNQYIRNMQVEYREELEPGEPLAAPYLPMVK